MPIFFSLLAFCKKEIKASEENNIIVYELISSQLKLKLIFTLMEASEENNIIVYELISPQLKLKLIFTLMEASEENNIIAHVL